MGNEKSKQGHWMHFHMVAPQGNGNWTKSNIFKSHVSRQPHMKFRMGQESESWRSYRALNYGKNVVELLCKDGLLLLTTDEKPDEPAWSKGEHRTDKMEKREWERQTTFCAETKRSACYLYDYSPIIAIVNWTCVRNWETLTELRTCKEFEPRNLFSWAALQKSEEATNSCDCLVENICS